MSTSESPLRSAVGGGSSHPGTVFLSAALGTDIDPVVVMLDRQGFKAMRWTQLPPGPIGRRLVDGLRGCVALIAVVDELPVAPAVVLEIGAALGRGLPAVILAGHADIAAGLEPALRELPVVSLVGDLDAVGIRLAETLRAVIEDQEAGPRSAVRPQQPGPHTPSILESRLEEWVAAVLRERGARVVAQPEGVPGSRHRPDFAIWIDGLHSPSLNPVLVEVKGAPGVHRSAAEEQLRQHLIAAGCVLGLVVVPGELPAEWHVTHGLAIATIGVDSLAELDLVGLLSDGRNRWAHGVR